MKYDNSTVNRTRLIDTPIVEMLLSQRFAKSGISFMKEINREDATVNNIICYGNGNSRNLTIKRNSNKYAFSPNFLLNFDKNKLNEFDNTSYIFIDEAANALYIVDGIDLLKYIIGHSIDLNMYENSVTRAWMLIPKSDIISMANDNSNHIIKYNKRIAQLFAQGRDENLFSNLA